MDYSATGVFVVTLTPNEPSSEGVVPMIMSAVFQPSEATKNCWDEITIVQAARTFQRRRASQVWNGWPFTMDSGWHPDPVAEKAYVINWTPSSKAGAYVYDTPGEPWFYVFQAFETRAKCIAGKWAGEILGCFYWADEIREGRVVHHAPRTGGAGRQMNPRAPRFFR